jgi:hypothetical protein
MHYFSYHLILLFSSASLLGCGETGETSVYVLPKNYQGVVFILYNQKDGEQPKYEDNNRVYEIPSNGILKTQFTPNVGWRPLDKFYYLDNGKRIEITYEQPPKTIKGDTIKICCFSSGTSSIHPYDTARKVSFAMFYVGTEKNLDILYEQGEKVNPATLVGN